MLGGGDSRGRHRYRLLIMVAARILHPPLSPSSAAVEFDQRVFLRGVRWPEYEAMLDFRGEAPRPRMAYLGGELELMSPSRSHEALTELLARLLVAYAEEKGIELEGYRSMTLRNAPRERGVEPDACYAIGGPKDQPDLAIEVVWTSGGLDELEIYRGLGVREVWMWRDEMLSVHVLRGEAYLASERSEVLPDLDLGLLASFLNWDTQMGAVRAYRAALRGG